MNGSIVTVLVVDDDVVDRMAIQRAFKTLKITNPVVEAANGIEALQRLRGENGYEKVAWPFLVLLDLNMPQMGGVEFLEKLRDDPVLHSSLVFVLTTSSAEEDRVRAYTKNIAGYLLKQRATMGFREVISMLEHYWRIVEFPPRQRGREAGLQADQPAPAAQQYLCKGA